jgi:hypothetical protein
VASNDNARPKVSLTIKASIVLWVNPEPDELSLLLKGEKAGCPNITLSSIDGQPFTVRSVTAPGDWLTVEFDPNVQIVKLVLEPKVDMEKLEKHGHGFIKISVVHPKCDTIRIPYTVLPAFSVIPSMVIVRDVTPGVPITKQVSIVSNYEEAFKIRRTWSDQGTVKVGDSNQTDHTVTLDLEVTPPPMTDRIFFKDNFYVDIKEGDPAMKVDVRGFYKVDRKTRRPTRRRR